MQYVIKTVQHNIFQPIELFLGQQWLQAILSPKSPILVLEKGTNIKIWLGWPRKNLPLGFWVPYDDKVGTSNNCVGRNCFVSYFDPICAKTKLTISFSY